MKCPDIEVLDADVFLQVKILHKFLVAAVVNAGELFRFVMLLADMSQEVHIIMEEAWTVVNSALNSTVEVQFAMKAQSLGRIKYFTACLAHVMFSTTKTTIPMHLVAVLVKVRKRSELITAEVA